MPQTATAEADRNKGARAPEYSASAGAKTSTDAHPVTETANEARQGVIVAFAVIYAAFFA